MSFLGTGIFWITILEVSAILIMATLIGRMWGLLFPLLLRPTARFYLGPVIGLASLSIVASLIGRFIPMGTLGVVPFVTIALLIVSLFLEQNKLLALRHAFMTAFFGMVCGVSVLAPLFVFGAMDAHNDAFTYLVHSNWLQMHPFSEIITPKTVLPQNTQVSIYQLGNFRMGGSFLLAFFQALFHREWSFEVYPSLVISALAVCCLAAGFPLYSLLAPLRRWFRLVLLVLPGFTLGGMVFGANFGFMPQTVGLAFGAGLLYACGPLLRGITLGKHTLSDVIKAALPMSIFFTASVYAYPELVPFLVLAICVSGGMLLLTGARALRFSSLNKILLHFAVVLGISILLLNTELLRTYAALKTQTDAVVGNPLEWSLLGYIAHAFGIHGGAWDMFQWSRPEGSGLLALFAVVIIFLCVLGFGFALRSKKHRTLVVMFLPVVIILMLFFCGVLYFRYLVVSPFPIGVGQSWSQFKLSDWAHPFVMAIVLFTLVSLRPEGGKQFDRAVLVLFALGLISSSVLGVDRLRPLMHYYKGVSDLNRFYLDLRKTVLTACTGSEPIYLALGGKDLKFRQMATMYLYDKEVISDWSDDGYISCLLPPELKIKKLHPGNYVLEPLWSYGLVNTGKVIGPFRIGVLDSVHGKIDIASVTGAYGRESDDNNWWHWVEHKVNFTLVPLFIPEHATFTKLYFDFRTRGSQTLKVQLVKHDGTRLERLISSDGSKSEICEQLFDVRPTEVTDVCIETNGKATLIGNGDSRVAAMIIRNVRIAPFTP